MDRRSFLWSATAAAVGLCAPPSWAMTGVPQTRAVNIIFSHTGEKYEGFYYHDGSYVMSEVQQFSWVCRDYRMNQWKWLHPHLMDLLFLLHWKYHQDAITIMSGYRTPRPTPSLKERR